MEKKQKDMTNLLSSLDKDTIDYLDEYLFRMVEDAYDKDADLRDKIFKWRMFYEMDSPPKTSPFDGCSNIMFDYVQSKTTGFLARLKEVLAGSSPVFEVIPSELTDIDQCEAREQFLEYKMTEPGRDDITRTIKDVLFNESGLEAVLTGTGILYNPFIEDVVTQTGIEVINSVDHLTEFFGEKRAKEQFSDTYQSLMAQKINQTQGRSNLIIPEEVEHDYDEVVSQHTPRCIQREDFIITHGAESIEKATLHGYLFSTTWNSLIKQYKDGYLKRVPYIAYSTEDNQLRDDEEDDVMDLENDPRIIKFWERSDIEMFEGIVLLDMKMVKKAAKLNINKQMIEEDDDPSADEFYSGLRKYKITMCTENGKGRIVRIEQYKPYHGRSEFKPLYIKKVPGRFDGIGMGQLLSQYLIESNKLFNMYSDANYLEVMPIFRVPAGSNFSPNKSEFPFRPYAVWESDMPIEKLEFKAPDPQKTMMILQQIQKRGDTISVPEILTGRESAADPNAPAAKTAMLMKQSQIAIGEGIELFSKFMKPIAYDMIEDLHQFGSQTMEYRIMNKKADDLWKEMDRDDLAKKADYSIKGKAEDLNKIIHEQQTVQDYQIFVQDPIVGENEEARRALLMRIAKSRDIEEVDIILPTKEELEKKMVKRQMMATLEMMKQKELQTAQEKGLEAQEHMASAQKNAQLGDLAQMKLIEGAQNATENGQQTAAPGQEANK